MVGGNFKFVICSQSNSSKNGNMVLQLVLPSSMQNGGNVDNGNFFSASYNDTLRTYNKNGVLVRNI